MYTYLPNKKFMIMGVYPKFFSNGDILSDLTEMEMLVKTYGGKVFALAVQKGERPSMSTYLRKGKLEEAAETIEKEKIDIIVAKDNLKPGLMYTLEKIFNRSNPDILVWDKALLILQIFDLHASSGESKLQIKIASLKHMGPRIYGMGYILSDEGAGIGSKGQGETNTEVMRRHWKNEIFALKKKIKDFENKRQIQIDRRRKLGLKTVSIVGYTNSGKSTLFNALTGKRKLAEHKLFATLDSSTGKLFLPKSGKIAILTDTIGFIRNLPPFLIDTFKSTLMESLNSDVIIHVIDASDPEIETKIQTVNKILDEFLLENKKILYVFNKSDLLSKEQIENLKEKFIYNSPLFLSAKIESGIKNLLSEIEEKLI